MTQGSQGAGSAALVAEPVGTTPLVAARSLTKRFGRVVAVDDVGLDLAAGEIVALLGQNGAGKSTLMQMLAGVHPAGSYDGTFEIAGEPFAPSGVKEAEAAGVVLIPQEINVVPDMTVAQDMFLAAEPKRFGLVDTPRLTALAGEALEEFGLDVDPLARMGTLDLATQQLVVIARALSKRARILILDEPTAALTEVEAERLFGRMRALRDRGVTCIFVSHRLPEVFAVADRILVMRDGRLRGDHRAEATTREEIVEEMVGGALAQLESREATPGPVALSVSGLTVTDADRVARRRVDGVDLELHEGEIVGLFGLLGSGVSAVALALYGSWPGPVEGELRVNGEPVSIGSPSDAIRHGIGLMAQDRRDTLIADHSIADNIALASLGAISRHGFLDLHAKRLLARRYKEKLAIRTPSVDTRVGALSGGNQQKVQVARWLAAGSRVLLLVDPTRGVDVGARAEIGVLWQQLADDGCALLLVSSEAQELLEVCDRILVMRHGRLVDEQAATAATEASLLHAAAGRDL